MTNYPAQIDNNSSLPLVTDNQTPVSADTVNRLRNAIIAVEAELGTRPSGTFATVRARLDHVETLITQQVVTIAGDLGGIFSNPLVIGLQGRPISSNAPSVGQVLGWNGLAWDPIGSIQLSQDLGNIYTSPYVVGLQGRPISDQSPDVNQVLTWNGNNWVPATPTAILNVLPTATILPIDIMFLGGDGYSNSSSPYRVGARAVNMVYYPTTTADGRARTMTFSADLEVTNPATSGTVLLKDVTNNAIVTGPTFMISNATNDSPIQITTDSSHSLITGQTVIISGIEGNTAANGTFIVTVIDSTNFTLNETTGNENYIGGGSGVGKAQFTTNSLSSVEASIPIISGDYPEVMRTDMISMYEVQIYVTGGSSADQVVCRNARIAISYSPPVEVSNLLALSLPTDINFVTGTALNGFTTPSGAGGRALDINKFPPTLTDNSGRTRRIQFYADVEVSAPGVQGYCQLFDTTNNVPINDTLLSFTNTIGTEINSIPLLVGTTAGTIRSDVNARYEVRIWKTSGAVSDRVICNNARITIIYE